MLSLEEAQRRTIALVKFLGMESIRLEAADGRVSAQDVPASVNVPGFDNSAMDGYAVMAGDVATATADGRPSTPTIRTSFSTTSRFPIMARCLTRLRPISPPAAFICWPATAPGRRTRRSFAQGSPIFAARSGPTAPGTAAGA